MIKLCLHKMSDVITDVKTPTYFHSRVSTPTESLMSSGGTKIVRSLSQMY